MLSLKVKIIILCVVLAPVTLAFPSAWIRPPQPASTAGKEPSRIMQEPVPVAGVERIVYIVKLGMVPIGQAVYQELPDTVWQGKAVKAATFETKVKGFYDKELLYSDPVTMLPVRVERDIRNMGAEKIVEEYNQAEHTLMITKEKNGKKEQLVVRKDGPIYNAILLPYIVRAIPRLEKDWSLNVVFPTQDFTIRLDGREQVKVPAGMFPCLTFSSIPKRFEILLSDDGRRVPIKIAGSAGIGYVMLMKEYSRK